MDELVKLSACALLRKMRAKEISASEVMEAHLNRIAQVNPIINAIIQQNEDARKQAKAADEAECLGPLHGLPVSVKNGAWVKGFVCDVGCASLRGPECPKDATAVRRLKEAGAIVLGLTNVPELNMAYETDNDLYGRTNNPYDLERTPGGSSGGEAAAIASGMSPLGLGSDAGGSIRVPCHYAGIAGLKTTQFRIPMTGLLPDQAMGLVTGTVGFGPMARFVEDLVLGYEVLAGADGLDPYCPPVALKGVDSVAVDKLRVCWFTNNGIRQVDQDTKRVVSEAARILKGEVALVHEETPPGLNRTMELFIEALWFGGDRGEGQRKMIENLGDVDPSRLLREMLAIASKSHFSQGELRQRLVEIDRLRIDLLGFMRDYDVWICPTVATPAKKHGDRALNIEDFSYAMQFNLLQWPATVVRCGTSEDGLPIGVQVVARPWEDQVALAVARRLEALCGGWVAPDLGLQIKKF